MNLTLLEKGLGLVLYLLCSNTESVQKGGWTAARIDDIMAEFYLKGHGLAFIFTHFEMISRIMDESGFHLLAGRRENLFPDKEWWRTELFFCACSLILKKNLEGACCRKK